MVSKLSMEGSTFERFRRHNGLGVPGFEFTCQAHGDRCCWWAALAFSMLSSCKCHWTQPRVQPIGRLGAHHKVPGLDIDDLLKGLPPR
jgi:hypothetical protein